MTGEKRKRLNHAVAPASVSQAALSPVPAAVLCIFKLAACLMIADRLGEP